MEYSIKKLADLAGVTRRTLRYYDQIGLLNPSRINSSGYRLYGEKEVDLLQQILFYRAMDFKLEDIKKIVSEPDFDNVRALVEHHKQLIGKRKQLDQLIITVEKTIAYYKGGIEMSNKEKFYGLKREKVKENEKNYGKEVREKYGEEIAEASNRRFMNISEESFKKMQAAEEEMFKFLKEVVKTKDLESKAAEEVYKKHKLWLSFTWASYTPEAHRGLAKMYLEDQRFSSYYNDRAGEDVVSTLEDIISKYSK